MYATCLQNPRGLRNLQEETALVMVTPGPFEPTLEQLNKIVAPFVQDMLELGNGKYSVHTLLTDSALIRSTGILFKVHAHLEEELVHSQLQLDVSDLPASRMVSGLAAHNCKYFMCSMCAMPFYSLVHPDCFTPASK